MHALRREFLDGPETPDLVLIHSTASPAGSPGTLLSRSSIVVPATSEPGKREVRLFFPSPPGGGALQLRYAFSIVHSGAERYSDFFETLLPGPETADDTVPIEVVGGGNLPPAPGRGTFRVLLPLREGEPGEGTARFGFGAMRKKPSESLCRVALPFDRRTPPVVEVPEALSVLKERPMPFFLYHVTEGGVGLVADKINSARITWRDEEGDVVSVRMLWSCGSWAAPNLTPLEVRKFSGDEPASGVPFAGDREAFLRARESSLDRFPLPRTHEGYLFGPAGSEAEYCFLLLRRRPDGTIAAEWSNRDGGNWTIRL